MPIDLSTMSPEEIKAEADRRWAARLTRSAKPKHPPSTAMRIVIPFALLVSDNLRTQPIVLKARGRPYPRMVLSNKYKKSKEQIRAIIRTHLADLYEWIPWDQPVRVTVTIYEPDRKRDRDITNWCKQLGDACSGLLYDDDKRVDDARYVRGPVDAAWPRAEIEVGPLP